MSHVETDGSRLSVDGSEIEFRDPISEVLEIDDIVVVRLDWYGVEHDLASQNVVAVERDGSIRWRIDKCPDLTGNNGHSVYNGLFAHDGELWITNLNGMKYSVDKQTVEITDKKFVK